MKFRKHYFKRESTIANTDTIIIDVNVKDPISAITVEYEATNGSSSSLDHELHDDISSIELVDGSNILWSLDMESARALNFFELSRLPHEKCNCGAAGTQEEKCIMHFGRFMDDRDFYLDPTRYNNLQLRLTHALTISSTVGFATGTGKVTVMARIIEEGAAPYKGFMCAKEKVSYTSGTSGEKEVDLPRDFPYRMMLLKALLTTKTHEEVLSKHRLSIDADAYVPFNEYSEDITDENIAQFGYAMQNKELLVKDDETALFDLYSINDVVIRTDEDDELASVEAVDAESVQVQLIEFADPGVGVFETTSKVCFATARGSQPYAHLCVPFGRLNHATDWLQAQNYGDIKLFSTQAAAGACSVILQQLRQ